MFLVQQVSREIAREAVLRGRHFDREHKDIVHLGRADHYKDRVGQHSLDIGDIGSLLALTFVLAVELSYVLFFKAS